MNQISLDYIAGNGVNKLAKKYNISSYAVKKILKSDSITVRQPSCLTVTNKQLIELSIKYHDAEISRIVGLSKTTVSQRLRSLGVIAKPTNITNRKYDIYIKDITQLDQEVGAYWFGFLLADGWLSKIRSRLVCNIQYRDFKHLQILCGDLRTLKTPRKRYVIVKTKQWKNSEEWVYKTHQYERASLIINCKPLHDFYKTSGWYEFKNGNPMVLPDVLNIRHFLRGFWDGDGIVTTNKNYLRLGVCSQYCNIIKWITNHLLYLDLGSLQKINLYNGCYYRFWSGSASVKIARFLYTNQTRSLNRKVSKIIKYL